MNSTKATSAMDNLSNSSQDSMEDPTQLRRVAESEDLEDVAEGQTNQPSSRQHSELSPTRKVVQDKIYEEGDEKRSLQNRQTHSRAVDERFPAPNKGKFYVPERPSIKSGRWEERAEVEKRLSEQLNDVHLLESRRMQRRSRRNKRRTERSISFEYQRRHEDTFRNQPIYRKKSEVNNTERIHFVKKTDIVQESPPTSTTKSTSPRTVTFTPNVDSSISRRRSVDHDRSFRASNSNNSNSTVSPSNQLPGSRRYSALRRSEQQPSQESVVPTSPPRRFYANEAASTKKYVPKHLLSQEQQQQQPSTVQPDNSNQNVNNRSQGRVSSQFQNQSQPSTQPSQPQPPPQPQQQQQQQQPKRYSTKRDQIVNVVAAPSTLSIDTSNVLPAQTSPLHSPVQVVPVPAPTTIYRLNNPLTATNPPLYAGFNYHPYAPSEVNNPYLVTPATPLYSSLPLTVVPQGYQYSYGTYPYFQTPFYDYGTNNGWLSESGTVYYPLAPQLLQYQLRRQQNVEQLRQNEFAQGASPLLQETNLRDLSSPSEERHLSVSESPVVSSNKEEKIPPSQNQTSSAPNLSIHASSDSASSTTSISSLSPPSVNATPITTTTATATTTTSTLNQLPQRTIKKTQWVPRVGTGSDSSSTVHQSSLSNGNPQ